MKMLPDQAARLRALTDHGSTLLVEAGAGSGKTALMAGRVVLMLAAGIAPRAIAAITFTELAAGQLFTRIAEFLGRVLADDVPVELAVALPEGIAATQRAHLDAARQSIAELTVTTIHGFAGALTRPYPVEAGRDPGARVMDEAEALLARRDLFREFLRAVLDGSQPDAPLAAFVLARGPDAQRPLQALAEQLLARPGVRAARNVVDGAAIGRLRQCVDRFVAWLNGVGFEEETTAVLAGQLRALADRYEPLRSTGDGWAQKMSVVLEPPTCAAHTQELSWRKWGRHGKWESAAGARGRSKAEGRRISQEGEAFYRQVGEAWLALHQSLDAAAFTALADAFQPLLERYARYKRDAALLDFEDLLQSARQLLRGHEDVRASLARRYAHVLVDEFQDTDPVQAEILWRLCGEGPADAPWSARALRAGALFCVGDPKQAIYRFRGADVDTYVAAREAIGRQLPGNILEVTANFRSVAPILRWVNDRFRGPLSGDGQPGFQDLSATRIPADDGARVLRLDLVGEAGGEQQNIKAMRKCEAEAVAALCRRLIGHYPIVERNDRRPVRPGDIALLAPAGTQLWRYEQALERQGIAVASQAGKGFYRRQEIQDLIALTRVLVDGRDTAAFGALLRGPLVGLTEEELLDIVAALPVQAQRPDQIPRLTLWTAPEAVSHPLARDVITRLQGLARRARSTTPFALLAEAVEEMRVRPLIRLRHPAGAERALANVDLYLELARPYAVRGLRVFATDMRARWEDAESQMEGRPDAEQQAVQLITMHSAKGLEWPIVIPVNTCGDPQAVSGVLHDRRRDELHYYVGHVRGVGYEACLAEEAAQSERERRRLLYVACTRAAELLILPKPPGRDHVWLTQVDLDIGSLPPADFAHLDEAPARQEPDAANDQSSAAFQAEAGRVAAATTRLEWRQPSRQETDEAAAGPAEEAYLADDWQRPAIRGGPVRGRVMHKLLEEILTRELTDDAAAVTARARELLLQLGEVPAEDPACGFAPAEIAAAALRALAVPAVAALRERLVPELPVYGWQPGAEAAPHAAITGIADAVARAADGSIAAVIDWKSDIGPGRAEIDHYRAQLREYQALTGAVEGLLVLATVGKPG